MHWGQREPRYHPTMERLLLGSPNVRYYQERLGLVSVVGVQRREAKEGQRHLLEGDLSPADNAFSNS